VGDMEFLSVSLFILLLLGGSFRTHCLGLGVGIERLEVAAVAGEGKWVLDDSKAVYLSRRCGKRRRCTPK